MKAAIVETAIISQGIYLGYAMLPSVVSSSSQRHTRSEQVRR